MLGAHGREIPERGKRQLEGLRLASKGWWRPRECLSGRPRPKRGAALRRHVLRHVRLRCGGYESPLLWLRRLLRRRCTVYSHRPCTPFHSRIDSTVAADCRVVSSRMHDCMTECNMDEDSSDEDSSDEDSIDKASIVAGQTTVVCRCKRMFAKHQRYHHPMHDPSEASSCGGSFTQRHTASHTHHPISLPCLSCWSGSEAALPPQATDLLDSDIPERLTQDQRTQGVELLTGRAMTTRPLCGIGRQIQAATLLHSCPPPLLTVPMQSKVS